MECAENELIMIGQLGYENDTKNNQILKIANENLRDLNHRYSNSFPIIYNAEQSKFEPSDYIDFSNYGVTDLLNKFVSWFLTKGKERNFHITTFLTEVENNFKLLKTDLHYIKLTHGIKDEHKIMVKSFIVQYENFAPKGFLVESEIAQIKNQLNVWCKKLKIEFLNESERYLQFEEHDSGFNPQYAKIESVQKDEKEELFKDYWMTSISNFFKNQAS